MITPICWYQWTSVKHYIPPLLAAALANAANEARNPTEANIIVVAEGGGVASTTTIQYIDSRLHRLR
jgi:hypothetical protein